MKFTDLLIHMKVTCHFILGGVQENMQELSEKTMWLNLNLLQLFVIMFASVLAFFSQIVLFFLSAVLKCIGLSCVIINFNIYMYVVYSSIKV